MARAEPIVTNDRTIVPPPARYTLDGDERVESRIDADQRRVAEAVAAVVPADKLIAIVLMGGYGRGEGGYIEIATASGVVPAPYNDYDYFVVVRRAGRAERRRLSEKLAAVARQLEGRVGVEVDFALLQARQLRRAEPSLMNTEMRWGHRVIAGDPDVLRGMPFLSFKELPAGELTRLMLNRGALLLMNQQRLREVERARRRGRGPTELAAQQREVFLKYLGKAVLACGDARLALSGQYHPSYPIKRERLERLDPPEPWRDALGQDRERFLDLYRFAYANKFHPDYQRWSQVSLSDWQVSVRRLWLATLMAYEGFRLGEPIANWTDYCRAAIGKGQASRRGGPLKNLAVTVRDFGIGELWRQPARALRYPRERLIATLPLLLLESGERPDPCVAPALGLGADAYWTQAADSFLRLWGRYA